ncbi:uncharacterized protein LOC141629418 [Silene latifolia]|uniref:uncharacterized protein LOC141629418 n=1 Tax=Silene latifolia TaxID=37657 RepID=UPI003D7800CD
MYSIVSSNGYALMNNDIPPMIPLTNAPETPQVGSENTIFGFPSCPEDLKPINGMMFSNLEDGIDFYNKYAKVCGFIPRLDSTKLVNGIVTHKRCVCNKEGKSRNKGTKRKRTVTRTGCEAKAMGDFNPTTIITDQCKGINQAVKDVFGDKTQHRLCMWHIMKKLPDKVGPTICQNTNFLKEINSIVWDGEIDTQEFELRWKSILSSYELSDHEWLKSMFDIRSSWILAYFRDIYLGGIMRTTSRSESENSFFGNFTNPHLTLVEFWMRFQSAMDAQHWKYAKMFERIGLLCKHVLWVLKDRGFDDIPTEYLLDRWGKYATCRPIFNVVGTTLLADYNEELGDELLELLRAFNEKLMISVKRGKSKNKKAEIEMLIGSKIPSEVSVLPPKKCKNKGSGRRITSNKEKAVQENAKPLRKYRACGEMTHHDSRNCPSRATQK